MTRDDTRSRVLTGIRPTGRLHLGHYVGALENWLRLQDEYDCLFLIADYQALGDHADRVDEIRASVAEVALDWLAVGLDPQRSSFVVQSYVPQHAELALLLSMLVPLARLRRNPTLKAEMAELSADHERVSVGFFTYPISQAADILLMKADLVPTGDDQLPHLELTREIARTFNRRYGTLFAEPRELIGRVSRLAGTDGSAKMSKSVGNVIDLADDVATLRRKVMSMYTDPAHVRTADPGRVAGNPVFAYLRAFDPNRAELEDLEARYARGGVGDVDVKQRLIDVLESFLGPIRERRLEFEARPWVVSDALASGSDRARDIAEETMRQVRGAMRIGRQDAALIGGVA
jgi:tryptophanyl-tRNA synthetase